MSCCGTCAATGGSCAVEKRGIGAIVGSGDPLTTFAYLGGGTLAGWWLGGQVASGKPAKVIGAVLGLLVGRQLLG